MKKINIKYFLASPRFQCGAMVFMLITLFVFGFERGVALAQEDADLKPIRSRMSLSVIQGDQDTITLRALVRAKIDDRYTGLPGLDVRFFAAADTLEKELGKSITGEGGFAELTLLLSELPLDTANAFNVGVAFDGNNKFKASDDEGAFVAADMLLEPVEEDSLRFIKVFIQSNGEPVADEVVSLYVKSMINPLKVGEGTTDEEGKALIQFPTDLPGDFDGHLHIFARLEDHWEFGTLVSNITEKWGLPVEKSQARLPRALWSPYPPLWLLFTFIAILVIIWGHYLEVIFKLIRLKIRASK